ncbi:hypothetical protein J5N97_014960 [Dioscorea zingiberensis]|uniref:C2H2-type domain-containing protein n=1 Tax=Dioscorea zingiberensis TaxID=325984 RepID=A0A9D5HK73_9LILI|nr:hypothetical protein J5N97_014960 [Dioscorea zingiberensis]
MKRFRFGDEGEMESINMANVLMLLSQGGGGAERTSSTLGRVFECKTCSRQFPSFQALGGHRASHKKPRGNGDGRSMAAAKPRTHECAICGLEFAIGQALGGHMRRHRTLGEGFGNGHGVMEKRSDGGDGKVLCLDLDLNLPPSPSGPDVERRATVVFGIDLVEKTPMVDCFH